MKRGLTLLLASLVLAVSLTACGGDTRDKQNGDAVLGSGNNGASDAGGSAQAPDSSANGGSGSDDRTGSNSGTGSGSVRDGMEDLEDGLDDAMRDAGDAVDGMMDDLTGNSTGGSAQGTPQRSSGPAWQGNLRKPSFPGSGSF